MRGLAIGLIGLVCVALPMPALASDAAVEAPIRAFIDSFNKGDVPGAAATNDKDVTIIDEVAPYRWSGAGAFGAWLGALAADSTAKGMSDQSVTIGDPTREQVTGAEAYVIVPAVYRFKQKGVAMSEAAQITFALHKGAAGWKITAWAWTGPEPTPVK